MNGYDWSIPVDIIEMLKKKSKKTDSMPVVEMEKPLVHKGRSYRWSVNEEGESTIVFDMDTVVSKPAP